MQNDEPDLVQRAKQRDVTAWSALYEQHYDDLYRYAFGKLGAREEAEDVASQVFVEALNGIDRFAYRRRTLFSWLLDIARKQVTERQRRAARANPNLAFAASAIDAGDTEPLVERLDLLEAIHQLTQEQQDVIILRFFVGKDTPEIAEVLGKKENAIFALQFRAINSLRRHLSPGDTPRRFGTAGGAS